MFSVLQTIPTDAHVPPPPSEHVRPFVHSPHSSVPPHPSSSVPQLKPCSAHVLGVHEDGVLVSGAGVSDSTAEPAFSAAPPPPATVMKAPFAP